MAVFLMSIVYLPVIYCFSLRSLSENRNEQFRHRQDSSQPVLQIDKINDVVSDEFRDPPEFAKPLTGAKPWQSLRVRDSRAIVRFDREARVMQVGTVGHRSSIYDEFP